MRILILLISILLITSCGYFETCHDTVYVKPDLPKLTIYEQPEPLNLGTMYNQGDFTCINSWGVCVPKDKLIELIEYIKLVKLQLDKSNSQSNEYNLLIDKLQ